MAEPTRHRVVPVNQIPIFHVLVSENYSLGTEFIDINPDRLQLLLLVLSAQVPVAVEIGAAQLGKMEETMRLIMTQA